MTKNDLKKQHKHLYNPPMDEVVVVDVPPISFLMIDGVGDPNTAAEYREAVGALYALAYGLKFAVKKRDPALDYVVMPLEGLWWVDDMRQFSVHDKASWKWTMMIALPDYVTADLFGEVQAQVAQKKPSVAIRDVRFESFREGTAAQIMHIGPYAAEEPTVAKVHAFINEHGYTLSGKHHEIYLKDPQKTAPERLQTIVRQPMVQEATGEHRRSTQLEELAV
jgi:hypothetical protein